MKRYIKSAIRDISTEDETTQREVAWAETTRGAELEALVNSPNGDVRGAALGNPNVPLYLLQDAAKSSNPADRYNVARNPSTPSDILEQLSYDWHGQVRCNVANNPNTSTEALERLTQDKDWMIRDVAKKQLATRGIEV